MNDSNIMWEVAGRGTDQLSVNITLPSGLSNIDVRIQEAIEDAKINIIVDAYEFWKSEASMVLTSSKSTYLKALGIEAGESGPQIALTGVFPTMLEVGTPAYDLVPGFLDNKGLTSRKIPMTIDGRLQFRTIHKNPYGAHVRNKNKKNAYIKPTTWVHPGFGDGLNLRKDTEKHVRDVLLAKYLIPAIQKAFTR